MGLVIRSRAPLRLGLAGGGTDLSPFSDVHGGFVLNATINLYAQAILEPTNDGSISFVACDQDKRISFHGMSVLPDGDDLRLHRAVYNRVVRQFNGGIPLSFKLTTFADAPAGSGLGTSSTMVVCILKAFVEWMQLTLDDYELAQLAYEIERQDLTLAGGKQDQYAAAFGGFNFIEFGPGDKALVNPLRVKPSIAYELEASTILFYTGQSRDSAKIIKDQITSTSGDDSKPYQAYFGMKNDALVMKAALLRGDFEGYSEVLNKSWEHKKNLAPSVTNSHLNQIYEAAIDAGALAGKLSGAGGGGFFMFYVPPQNRFKVISRLSQYEGNTVGFNFELSGVQSWRY